MVEIGVGRVVQRAAELAAPSDVADTDNSVIRAISLQDGSVRTVAGTGELGLDPSEGLLATETKLRRPFGIEFDHDGNLYISDTINSRIVKVTR